MRPSGAAATIEIRGAADNMVMSLRQLLALLVAVLALSMPAAAGAYGSLGTPEQIAWVRRAAGNFLNAELQGNGAGACGILNAPLRATQHHRTCQQRWNAKLAAMLRDRHVRAGLRSDRRAVASARVVVHGDHATISLPQPLMGSSSRFLWTEMCWMLQD